jgi:hypothetical protein
MLLTLFFAFLLILVGSLMLLMFRWGQMALGLTIMGIVAFIRLFFPPRVPAPETTP